jgi:hypothetical protein
MDGSAGGRLVIAQARRKLTLKQAWPQLSDLDRAYAVTRISKSGMSRRRIATGIGTSESLLRHLLLALQAPPQASPQPDGVSSAPTNLSAALKPMQPAEPRFTVPSNFGVAILIVGLS